MLSIKNLSKTFYKNQQAIKVLDDININIEKNEIIGLIGNNGAGKTTLIKCICNLIKATSGDIYLDGKRLDNEVIRNDIGVMLEGARNLYHFLTINDNLDYFGYLNHLQDAELDKRKRELLDLFDLHDRKNTVVNELSRGTQQKVAIMVSLLKSPKILILDEPTLGLDLISTVKMKRTIKEIIEEKRVFIVILISHDMNLISDVCSRIILLNDGKIDIDERIGNIITPTEYEAEIEADVSIANLLSSMGYEYKEDENIMRVRTKKIDDILALSSQANILSIGRIEETLESFIARRFGKNV